jgi:hypothetical protein
MSNSLHSISKSTKAYVFRLPQRAPKGDGSFAIGGWLAATSDERVHAEKIETLPLCGVGR